MFTLFHFGFEIFKIAIQAAVYALTILTLKFVLTEIIKNDSLRLIKFKPVYLSVSALMLVFSFTYYGDHGLGDEANIPLGHWKSMNSTDGNPYFALSLIVKLTSTAFLFATSIYVLYRTIPITTTILSQVNGTNIIANKNMKPMHQCIICRR